MSFCLSSLHDSVYTQVLMSSSHTISDYDSRSSLFIYYYYCCYCCYCSVFSSVVCTSILLSQAVSLCHTAVLCIECFVTLLLSECIMHIISACSCSAHSQVLITVSLSAALSDMKALTAIEDVSAFIDNFLSDLKFLQFVRR